MPDLGEKEVNRTQSCLPVVVGSMAKESTKRKSMSGNVKKINPAKRELRNDGGVGVFLDRVVSEDLTVKQKPKIRERESHAEFWGESIPGRRRNLE